MATTYHDAAVSEVRYGNWRRQEFYLLKNCLEALRRRLKILRHAVLWLGDEHAVQLAARSEICTPRSPNLEPAAALNSDAVEC
jgi:hypothetical protein